MPHPEIFNLDEFTALGLRRNPLPTVEILELDNSDSDDTQNADNNINSDDTDCLSEDDVADVPHPAAEAERSLENV